MQGVYYRHDSLCLVSQLFCSPYYYSSIHTHWGANSVGFGVNEASDLGEVAVALRDKLNGGGLHEESVVRGEHTVNALLNVLHHHRVPPTAHELPHLIIRGDLGFL